MAWINVAGLTLDPMFADKFTVIRNKENRSRFGEVIKEPQRFEGLIGAVYPTGSNSLTREEAYQQQAKTITVVTKFRLQGPSPGFQPDTVEWRGSLFIVKSLNDYTQDGAGFIEAECTSVLLEDPPPE